MGGSSAYIDHADAVGSTTMETDPAGGWQWDIVYFPWGQIWQQTGTRQSGVFADLDWQVNDPLRPSATREYSANVNRWVTPDPDNGGADVGDSQSWNMYSYAGDNPSSRNDPSGEDYKVCQQGESNGSTNCTVLTDSQYDAFVEQNKDTLSFAGSKIFANGTQIGTSEYIPTIDPSTAFALRAVGDFANAQIKSAAVNMAINGALAGAGALIGPALEGTDVLGAQTLGIGRFVNGQGIRVVVDTAEGPLEITGEVETQGSRIILKKSDVAHPEGLGVRTHPGVGSLKAAIDALKGQFTAHGFTQLEIRSLRTSGANAPRFVNMVINLQ
ncbi:MAG TPA: RHS repeat-associated core domain-containing protein [Terriglobia bacterium]|nr:RHS repeat-associated core domain-containing protein [Terriglobia bacterium]